MFFVEDSRIANQLKRLRNLESRDGDLLVLVKPCPPPRGVEDGDQRQQRYVLVRGTCMLVLEVTQSTDRCSFICDVGVNSSSNDVCDGRRHVMFASRHLVFPHTVFPQL